MKRKIKDKSIAEKLYAIAEIVGDLNAANQVKCGVQNDYGYATIVKLAPGCNVRLHHLFDNTLSLDFLMSPKAQVRFSSKFSTVKSKLIEMFPNKTMENKNFVIPSRKNEPHYRLWIDVTSYSIEKLSAEIKSIQNNIKTLCKINGAQFEK